MKKPHFSRLRKALTDTSKLKLSVVVGLGFLIVAFTINFILLSPGDKHKLYFSRLSTSANLTKSIDFTNGGIGIFECLDICDSAKLHVKASENMSIEDFNFQITQLFSDRFEPVTETDTKLIGYATATPSYYRYCARAEEAYSPGRNKEHTYTRSEDCPYEGEVNVLKANWVFEQRSSLLESIFLPLPRCRTLSGNLTSSNSYLNEPATHDGLEAIFSCESADPSYFVDILTNKCGSNNSLCVEE